MSFVPRDVETISIEHGRVAICDGYGKETRPFRNDQVMRDAEASNWIALGLCGSDWTLAHACSEACLIAAYRFLCSQREALAHAVNQ